MSEDDSNSELPPSELGTKKHWDDAYAVELDNFSSRGDEGEVWFGEDALFRVLGWMDGHARDLGAPVLDLGCGNGITCAHLAASGFRDVSGVDYSEDAVRLARKVAEKRGADVKLEVGDILRPDSCALLGRRYSVCVDKGTYDAVSLDPDDAGQKRRRYVDSVLGLLEDGGMLIITSCNWTEHELKSHFTPRFSVRDVIPTPQFTFGGVVGNMVTSIVFEKNSGKEDSCSYSTSYTTRHPMAQKWHQVSRSCERRHRSVMELLSERSTLESAPAGLAAPSRPSQVAALTQRIRQQLQLMKAEVAQAAEVAEDPSVTAGERSRRRRKVEEFRNWERQSSELFSRERTPGSSERDLLLDGGGPEDLGSAGWGATEDTGREERAQPQAQPQAQAQEEILQAQDEGLDSLHTVIARQKRLAEAIGGEAEAQVELLGDLDEDMERARNRLADTTRGVAGVERRSGGTGRYWAVIVGLLVLIVIVAALPGKTSSKTQD